MLQFILNILILSISVTDCTSNMCLDVFKTLCWEMSSERQVYCLRKMFISQILRQDITWFDLNDKGDLSTKLSEYVSNET